MQSIPNIVRQRLKAQTSEANHPDEDLLSAFVEKSLPQPEHGNVLEHLAHCGECRNVVALSLPATESIQPAIRPSPARWLTWPALRWGLATAGVAVIATFGVVQYQRNSAATPQFVKTSSQNAGVKVAAKAAPLNLGSDAEKKESPARTASAELPAGDNDRQPSPQHQNRQMVASAKHPALQTNGSRPAATFSRAFVAPSAPTSATLQPPAGSQKLSGQVQTVEVANGTLQIQTEASQVGNESLQASASDSDARIGKAKSPVPAEISGAAPAPNADSSKQQAMPTAIGRNFTQLTALEPAVAPSWNITSTGSLQRSFDKGATWQDVDVAAASDDATMGGSVKARAAQTPAAPRMKKQAALPVFRAIAANGPDVWAGGNSGLLWHSVDGGNHWTRVIPSTAGSFLAGDIVSVDFPDAQHGRITTSAPEVWTTADNGGSWQKQ